METFKLTKDIVICISEEGSWWQRKDGMGKCWYESESKTLFFGPNKVYGSYHHYPCGNEKIDAEMKAAMDYDKENWPRYINSLPELPFPVDLIESL